MPSSPKPLTTPGKKPFRIGFIRLVDLFRNWDDLRAAGQTMVGPDIMEMK